MVTWSCLPSETLGHLYTTQVLRVSAGNPPGGRTGNPQEAVPCPTQPKSHLDPTRYVRHGHLPFASSVNTRSPLIEVGRLEQCE